jgi:2-dehydro-3-deoxygluconokinase
VPDILAIGEPLVELAAEERGPLARSSTFRRGWGGDTFNCTVAAARLGASTGYITRVGDDPFGTAFLRLCQEEGIDPSHVITDRTAYTGLYMIAIDEEGSHSFTYYRRGSAASRLTPKEIDEGHIGEAKVLHTSGITQAISDSALAATDHAIEAARARGVTVSYDANIRPALRPVAFLRTVFEATAGRADIVFLSREDMGHLYGPVSVEEAVARLLDLGAGVVVVKSGYEGCVVASAETAPQHCSPWSAEVVDPSGGGDAFAGAFLVQRVLGGASLAEAGRFANAVGALVVAGLGAVASIPTRARVAEFMATPAG